MNVRDSGVLGRSSPRDNEIGLECRGNNSYLFFAPLCLPVLHPGEFPETGKVQQNGRRNRFSKKRKILLSAAVVAIAAIIIGSAAAMGPLSAGNPGSRPEGLGIEGIATITLYGPSGQTLGVWTTHNSLVQPGLSDIIFCLTSASFEGSGPGSSSVFCPGGTSSAVTSYTAQIGVAIGGACNSAYSSCGIFAPSTNTVGPTGCVNEQVGLSGAAVTLNCNEWTASAVFGPSALNCPSTCTLNDVASGALTYSAATSTSGGFAIVGAWGQFDDICSPSPGGVANPTCLSGTPPAKLPSGSSTITVSAVDSLAVNIQFTVS